VVPSRNEMSRELKQTYGFSAAPLLSLGVIASTPDGRWVFLRLLCPCIELRQSFLQYLCVRAADKPLSSHSLAFANWRVSL